MILKELAATLMAPLLALSASVAPPSDCIATAKTQMNTALTGLTKSMQTEKAKLQTVRTKSTQEIKTALDLAILKAKQIKTAGLKATESLTGTAKAEARKKANENYNTLVKKARDEASTATRAATTKYNDAIKTIRQNESVESEKIKKAYKALVVQCNTREPGPVSTTPTATREAAPVTNTAPIRERAPVTGPMTVPLVPPVGVHDAANCEVIGGWAADQNTPNDSVAIEVYDGPVGSGTLIASAQTTGSRPDANAHLTQAWGISVTGNHGYTLSTPNSLKDNAVHSIYVYAINSNAKGGENILLSSSPRKLGPCTSNLERVSGPTNF